MKLSEDNGFVVKLLVDSFSLNFLSIVALCCVWFARVPPVSPTALLWYVVKKHIIFRLSEFLLGYWSLKDERIWVNSFSSLLTHLSGAAVRSLNTAVYPPPLWSSPSTTRPGPPCWGRSTACWRRPPITCWTRWCWWTTTATEVTGHGTGAQVEIVRCRFWGSGCKTLGIVSSPSV